jgi:hypothetical protein
MPAVRLAQTTAVLLGICVAIAVAAPPASAQSSVKAVFEKNGLLGTFAFDCTKPASKSNSYWVNRAIDDGHVQRDQMSGTTTREWIAIIDKAAEAKPNEIALSGTRDDKPTEGVWRIERKGDDLRVQIVESSFNGKKLITGGKWLAYGRDWPWINKCGK